MLLIVGARALVIANIAGVAHLIYTAFLASALPVGSESMLMRACVSAHIGHTISDILVGNRLEEIVTNKHNIGNTNPCRLQRITMRLPLYWQDLVHLCHLFDQ
jgi:hypothetical protein